MLDSPFIQHVQYPLVFRTLGGPEVTGMEAWSDVWVVTLGDNKYSC